VTPKMLHREAMACADAGHWELAARIEQQAIDVLPLTAEAEFDRGVLVESLEALKERARISQDGKELNA